jgi:hypothetical protein
MTQSLVHVLAIKRVTVAGLSIAAAMTFGGSAEAQQDTPQVEQKGEQHSFPDDSCSKNLLHRWRHYPFDHRLERKTHPGNR